MSKFFVIEQPSLSEVTFDSILGKTNVCFVLRNIKCTTSSSSSSMAGGSETATSSNTTATGTRRLNKLRPSISCPFSSFTQSAVTSTVNKDKHATLPPTSPPPVKCGHDEDELQSKQITPPSHASSRATIARGKTETVSQTCAS